MTHSQQEQYLIPCCYVTIKRSFFFYAATYFVKRSLSSMLQPISSNNCDKRSHSCANCSTACGCSTLLSGVQLPAFATHNNGNTLYILWLLMYLQLSLQQQQCQFLIEYIFTLTQPLFSRVLTQLPSPIITSPASNLSRIPWWQVSTRDHVKIVLTKKQSSL